MSDNRKKILIEPGNVNLSIDDRKEMDAFLFAENEEKQYQNVSFSNNFYLRTDDLNTPISVAQTLFKRACKKNPSNEHYELLSKKPPIANNEDAQIAVYEISGTYKKTSHNSVYKNRLADNDQKNKERVVKIYQQVDQDDIKKIKKEYQLTKLFPKIGMKPPTFFMLDDVTMSCSVMTRLAGKDLYEIILADRDEKTLTTEERIKLSIALLEALDQVHQKNIVHRDLKPENIKVFQKDGEWQVTIYDFNLSKFSAEDDKGEIPGSNSYISPEVVNGKGSSYLSDIEAMALILGVLWHAAVREEVSGLENLLEEIADYRFPGLYRGIDDLAAEYKKEIKDGLVKMYAFDPEKRLPILDMAAIFKNILIAHQAQHNKVQLNLL